MARSDRTLALGAQADWDGDITKNRWVGARSARPLEVNLRFQPGRLAAGWWILLLKQTLAPSDFRFTGTTLRSGGREGLPAATEAAEQMRPHVHDRALAELGEGDCANARLGR